ncbi:hypothetical protein GW590_05990 [Rahnella sp. SAP-1]|jgi:hypothetical protein|uniref:Chalcone isomerase domain-containing protein n=1 Tax=Rouxiella aceris TaxID=2703884 RepID=A0A848MGD5_9GAMM|nr:hypothetical protein [Rouxiella aceris]NMP26416.1 hypothetical protein [Rouxiella aceris]
MKALVIGLLLMSASAPAICAQVASWSSWPVTGSAKLTWAFLDVYNSELRTPSGKYRPNEWPLALAVSYLRDISREDLTEATADQWKALGLLDEANQHHWLEAVQAIWPDATSGNEITFLADQHGGQFYYQADKQHAIVPLGQHFSPAFRDAFLAIWLSPSTQYPLLRLGLIGPR